MTDVLRPRDARDVEEALRWAVAEEKPLELAGQASKRHVGRPSQTDLTLDLSGLAGVTLYEPEELVLSAKAGTPIAEIEGLLEKHNQQLAFEPADYGPLFGQPAGQGTLGVTAVTGRAETIRTGGRVVKNVTGYDLCKVLAGSWGTLAAMTEITLKVLPKPETEATVLVEGLIDRQACAAMAAATGSSADVSGAAHLPDHVASWFAGLPKAEAATVLRLEGVAPSVKHRQEQLAALMKPFGPVTILDETASRALWRDIRDLKAFAVPSARQRPLWRLSVEPASGYRLVDLITPAAQMAYDWAGGLVWVGMPYEDEPDAGSVRAAVAELGGHATLIRAPAAVRATVDVFQPEEPSVRALNRRVKQSFDPKGVLNPGRLWAGV